MVFEKTGEVSIHTPKINKVLLSREAGSILAQILPLADITLVVGKQTKLRLIWGTGMTVFLKVPSRVARKRIS